MAITTLTASTQAAPINYSYSTNGTTDFSGISNNTFFYDLVTKLPYFKDSGGNVQDVFFTGGTITGGLTATTISATTYQNLPTDIRVTGGTYSNATGTATFTNNTGGTFNVSGFYTGSNDVFITGGTYNSGTTTFTNSTGGTFSVSQMTQTWVNFVVTLNTVTTGTTYYPITSNGTSVAFVSRTARQTPVATSGTAKNLYLRTNVVTVGGSLTVSLHINATTSALSIVIPANSGVGVYSNTSSTATLVAGDLLSYEVINNSSSTAITSWGFLIA